MKLSIIVPVYNVEKYVEKTLTSVCNQDFDDYEIIVVNDGSPDNSLKICEDFAKRSSRNIKIISQDNGGLSKARNTGISNSTGEYVWFIDSDDWIEENCLSALCSLLTDNVDELVIGGDNVSDDTNEFLSSRNLFPKYHLQTLTGAETWEKGICQLSAAVFTIYRRDFLTSNKLWFIEGIYHEDAEFCPKASYLSKATRYYSKVIYHVRQNPNSITRKPNIKKSYDNIFVAHMLSCFCESNVMPRLKPKFYRFASIVINNAFNGIYKCSGSDIEDFEKAYSEYNLTSALRKSGSFKYIIECLLISVTRKPILSFRLLNRFK